MLALQGARVILALPEVAHQMALLPLLSLWLLWGAKQDRNVAWWWVAMAFAVSWVADSASHLLPPWVISLAYPVTQAALVGAVLLERRDALLLTVCLGILGIGAATWGDLHGPDLLLRTAAWGSIAVVAYERKALDRLRVSLLVSFGLGLVCWMGYAAWPGWTSWSLYQGVRLAAILIFCSAAVRPAPRLRLAVVR